MPRRPRIALPNVPYYLGIRNLVWKSNLSMPRILSTIDVENLHIVIIAYSWALLNALYLVQYSY